MKIATLTLTVAAAATLAAMTASALAQSAPAPAKPADADGMFVTAAKFSEPDGATLYKHVCADCHMPDAKGAKGAGFYPALAGNPKLIAKAYPVQVVLHGLNGMPPVGAMMSDQQVADVINHVRTHFGNKYKDAVTAADAKAAR